VGAVQERAVRHLYPASSVETAAPADLAQIVAHQIDDHGQLGRVFYTGQQLFPIVKVPGGCFPSGPGAFDGPGFNHPAGLSDEPFRRSGYDVMITGMDIGKKRGRVLPEQIDEKPVGIA